MISGTDKKLRILFVGVDWDGKGGDLVVETAKILLTRGIENEVSVVGCVPPKRSQKSNVKVYGFLDKNSDSDRLVLESLYRNSDIFFVPSRSDCFGIVYSEAAAFGLPSVCTATGGVPEVVIDSVTGLCLPPTSGPEDYASRIQWLVSDKSRLELMKTAARENFSKRLNWSEWGKIVSKEIITVGERHSTKEGSLHH